MDIKDIKSEHLIKVSPRSITIKDSTGKTQGVVTSCKTFGNLSCKDKFDAVNQLSQHNISAMDVLNFKRHIIHAFLNKTVYLFYNIKLREDAKKYSDLKGRLTKIEAIVKAHKDAGICVIECLFD